MIINDIIIDDYKHYESLIMMKESVKLCEVLTSKLFKFDMHL